MGLAARIRPWADATGRGLAAGAAGTVAITASATAEMKLRGRAPSSAPADVAAKLLGVKPRRRGGQRFATAAHLLSGLALGLPRGWLQAAGVRGAPRELAFFALSWTPDLVVVPAAGASGPPWRWGTAELAISALHHVAYAGAASAACAALERAPASAVWRS